MKLSTLSKAGSLFLTVVMAAAIVAIPAGNAKAVDDIEIDEQTFPDEGFRDYVSVTLDKDKDGSLSEGEITTVDMIYIAERSISDLTGIEYFTSLKHLYCYDNQLKTLDLSKNTELETVSCYKNQLTELNLSGCTKLTKLYCDSNKLTHLDLSTNKALEIMECYGNDINMLNIMNCPGLIRSYEDHMEKKKEDGIDVIRYDYTSIPYGHLTIDTNVKVITGYVVINEDNFPDDNFRKYVKNTLDITGDGKLMPAEIEVIKTIGVSGYDIQDLTGIEYFTYLTYLECISNELTSLDVSANTALETLFCYSNKITNLNISNNPELGVLYCNLNSLSSLDISNCPKLYELCCYGNDLAVLDIRHSNDLVNSFQHAPNFETRYDCNVANYSSGKLVVDRKTEIRIKDLEADCIAINMTNFPDDHLRQYVSYVCDKDKDNQLSPSEIEFVTKIDVGGLKIADLKGIEFFKYLEILVCDNNELTSLDVSKNTKLTQLSCSNNKLTSLNLNKNTDLISLICYQNELTTLEIGLCKDLNNLACYFNKLTVLDVSKNTKLQTLDCSVNELEAIEVKKNTQLTVLSCAFNKIKKLDLSNNTSLYRLDCSVNELNSLDLSKNTSLEFLSCSENNLTTLDISRNKVIWELYCSKNKLKELDLSNNTNLYTLYCYDNQLTGLDLTNNSFMRCLSCYKNKIKSIDISKCSLLIKAYNGNGHGGGELGDDINVYEEPSLESCKMCLDKTTKLITSAPTKAPSKPSATPSVTKSPTAIPSVTSAPKTDDPKAQILAFVERIYTYVLDREPEADGAAFWSDELYAFRRTGAEVAQGFIFSPEFEGRKTSDEQFVTILYKTFFGRDPEEGGMKYWLDQLSTGTMDRVTVANGFIYSQEWADTCASYGIRSGGDLKPAGKIAPTDLTYAFVERMYTTCMGRGYDEEGKQYWAGELANFNVTGEVCGAAFFLSDEMVGYNLSDKDYLGRLYATFMNREPDADGESYWLGVMASGATRADVVFGFTRSPEFTEKCVEARILPY